MLSLGGAIGCISKTPSGTTAASAKPIVIDGSSTVYPISQAIAERYNADNPHVEISVGQSGTGGGMKKFIVKEIDICNASRRIKDSEKEQCAAAGIEYLELEVAVDGLTVVVNQANDWAPCLKISDLQKIWEPGSRVKNWSDVNPHWPAEPIKLFGADTDSGTFEYFTEVVNGKARESRTDYTSSSNDNVLVNGVVDSKFALGYFGYGYYVENQDRLKAVAIQAKDEGECVTATPETIENGTYAPMSRPLFIYVNKAALHRPEVASLVEYFLSDAGQTVVGERKFIRLSENRRSEMQTLLTTSLKSQP